MIKVVLIGPMYRENAVGSGYYQHRPDVHELDSFDSEPFERLQMVMRDPGKNHLMPWWNADGIRIEIDGDDIVKLDSQFINLPRTINAKTRYYSGEMAMFIMMNYQANT
jgi:hypothetical protein